MKPLRVLPFLVIPAVPLLLSMHRSGVETKPTAIQLVSSTNTVRNLPPLTSEQNQTLDSMITFLETYTGNGKLNYGSIDRMAKGICEDIPAIHEEAETMPPGIKANAARNYPKNNFVTNALVKREITSRTRGEIIEDFEKFGVDPETENTPDDSPIENFVTKKELYKYRDDAARYKAIVEKDLGLKPGQQLVFREGVSIDDIKFVKERNIGFPPGAGVQVDLVISGEDSSVKPNN